MTGWHNGAEYRRWLRYQQYRQRHPYRAFFGDCLRVAGKVLRVVTLGRY